MDANRDEALRCNAHLLTSPSRHKLEQLIAVGIERARGEIARQNVAEARRLLERSIRMCPTDEAQALLGSVPRFSFARS